jgi:hypothetical protein
MKLTPSLNSILYSTLRFLRKTPKLTPKSGPKKRGTSTKAVMSKARADGKLYLAKLMALLAPSKMT